MKKYLRSQTKVASRVVFDRHPKRTGEAAAAARAKTREYNAHWTKARSRRSHEMAFGV